MSRKLANDTEFIEYGTLKKRRADDTLLQPLYW